MNPFVLKLVEGEIDDKPLSSDKLVIEDNIGESVHIHFRNLRLELSIEEFSKISNELENALERLERWES